MESSIIEASYPLTFRAFEAEELGKHLKSRHSVVLIGMKRVGISNFLRFFLNHKDTVKTYIADGKNYLFVSVDLNDLVELELFPFWTLVLKRIVDASEDSNLPAKVKKYIQTLFLESIQTQDLFFTIDSVRRSLVKIVGSGILPVLFLIRFDRIKDAVTSQFFANLEGLKDATHQKMSYVFTSFKSLNTLAPSVFTKASLGVFSKDLYIKPAKSEDAKIISRTYKDRYRLNLSKAVEESLLDAVDGYVQYLQLALILLHEGQTPSFNKTELFESLLKDERIALQSEELWESLVENEKAVLLKVSKGGQILLEERDKARYLWDTGFIVEKNNTRTLFSPLFDYYLKQREKSVQTESHGVEFTKKENALFNFLKERTNEVCEREKIVEVVWPEVEELGVSDWAIDRLVARVRNKLKLQKSEFEIQTVKTRGYKLIEAAKK